MRKLRAGSTKVGFGPAGAGFSENQHFLHYCNLQQLVIVALLTVHSSIELIIRNFENILVCTDIISRLKVLFFAFEDFLKTFLVVIN